MNHPVIFVNGVPAAGKTTVAKLLVRRYPNFRFVDGDDRIRAAPPPPVDPEKILAYANRLFTDTLDDVEAMLVDTDVVFAGAWYEQQVVAARDRFGFAAMLVVLRIDEAERARRQRRRTRQLAYEPDGTWEERPGPDALYDLVLDAVRLNPSDCVHCVMAEAEARWEGLRT